MKSHFQSPISNFEQGFSEPDFYQNRIENHKICSKIEKNLRKLGIMDFGRRKRIKRIFRKSIRGEQHDFFAKISRKSAKNLQNSMKNQRNLQNSMKKKTSLLLKVVIVFDGDDWIRDFLFELFKFKIFESITSSLLVH